MPDSTVHVIDDDPVTRKLLEAPTASKRTR
jgi:hypothetical protein